jgi:hypothetical protein
VDGGCGRDSIDVTGAGADGFPRSFRKARGVRNRSASFAEAREAAVSQGAGGSFMQPTRTGAASLHQIADDTQRTRHQRATPRRVGCEVS